MAVITKGKSFSFNSDDIEGISHFYKQQLEKQERRINSAVTKGTEMAWRIAHQRRPYISKSQMKAEGRSYRVSDPNAKLGVPVAEKNGGALQASIQKRVTTKFMKAVGEVWTDLYYAKYLEYGTSKMQARPFMRPALALVREAMKGLLRAV